MPYHQKGYLLLFFLLLPSLFSLAQSPEFHNPETYKYNPLVHKYRDFISLEVGVASHSLPDNKTLLNDYAPTIEFSYAIAANHRNDHWLRYTNTQYVGVSVLYIDMSNYNGLKNMAPKGSFGSAIALLPSAYMRIHHSRIVSGYMAPTFGICFQTKTWYDNPSNYNRFVSSKLNFCTKLDYLVEVRINTQTSITTGLRFLHYSNAAFYLPNTGMNMFTTKIGIKYNI